MRTQLLPPFLADDFKCKLLEITCRVVRPFSHDAAQIVTPDNYFRFCAPRRGQGSFLCEVFYARTNVSIPKGMTTLASRTLETLNVRLHRDAFLYVISSNRVEINNFATVDCRSECTHKCSVGGIPVRISLEAWCFFILLLHFFNAYS